MNSQQETNNCLEVIKFWLKKQYHLPQNIDESLLKRFLHTCNYSIEQTKNLIELFYTIRSQAPEIFSNRDPASSELQEIFNNFDFIPLPKLRNDNSKVFIYHIRTADPEKYHFINALKVFFIFADIRMLIENEISDGEIPIFDMSNFTLKHLTKVNLSILKKYMLYTQEAHPIKLKEIHLLNTPNFLDKCMHIVKPFMKNEIGKMIYTHLPHSQTLYEYIPKEILPLEYEGENESLEKIKKWWISKIMENRDYLIDESRWTVDETKRVDKNGNCAKQMFGMEGSFKTLNID